jgi:beta-glucosidase
MLEHQSSLGRLRAPIIRGCAALAGGLALLAVAASASCTHPRRGDGGNPPVGGQPDGSSPPPPGNSCTDGLPADEVVDGSEPDNVKTSCTDEAYCDPWSPGYTPDPEVQSQVQLTLGSMSLSEKADQMRGTNPGGGSNYSDIFRTPDNTNKGIKGFLFRDGPNGVNLAAQLPQGQDGYSTSFPVPMARGATFDMDLEYQIGQAMGDETVASGNTMLLAPAVNILRHPAWGRAQEIYGEDSFHLGRLGTAFVAGVQQYVPACVKHYAANNIENGRSSANSQMDEQTLREIYGSHFDHIVREGGVACVMAAYNMVNGVKATQNKHLLTEMLIEDMGFKGFTLSDWWAMPPGTAGASTDSLQANAAEAINAGLHMELPWAYNYQHIEAITGPGRPVDEATITESARRILEQKFRFKVGKTSEGIGLKAATTTKSNRGSIEGNQAHIALAHRAALEAITLLKNAEGTLPIDRGTVHTIAVIGAEVPYHVVNTDHADGVIRFSTDLRLGDLGSGRVFPDPAKSSGPFAGIQAIAGSGINVVSGSSASLADNADFVVVVAGLTPQDEGEEYTGAGDRPNFSLDGKGNGSTQDDLIAAVANKNKPMVVVLEGGSVIDMPWLNQVPAVVMAWYAGMDGGRALGKLLFGEANFSGKTPITWPKRWEDEPTFNAGTTTTMDYFLGYRWFDKHDIEPLFAFGHGLSYTTFEYKHLQVPCSDVTKNGVVYVKVDITNTGTVAGDEVAFLFVSFPSTQARRSVKELKGFHRVSLEPGQTKRITIPLRISDLRYWDSENSRWQVESGPVQIMVGPSAASLLLTDTMTVN